MMNNHDHDDKNGKNKEELRSLLLEKLSKFNQNENQAETSQDHSPDHYNQEEKTSDYDFDYVPQQENNQARKPNYLSDQKDDLEQEFINSSLNGYNRDSKSQTSKFDEIVQKTKQQSDDLEAELQASYAQDVGTTASKRKQERVTSSTKLTSSSNNTDQEPSKYVTQDPTKASQKQATVDSSDKQNQIANQDLQQDKQELQKQQEIQDELNQQASSYDTDFAFYSQSNKSNKDLDVDQDLATDKSLTSDQLASKNKSLATSSSTASSSTSSDSSLSSSEPTTRSASADKDKESVNPNLSAHSTETMQDDKQPNSSSDQESKKADSSNHNAKQTAAEWLRKAREAQQNKEASSNSSSSKSSKSETPKDDLDEDFQDSSSKFNWYNSSDNKEDKKSSYKPPYKAFFDNLNKSAKSSTGGNGGGNGGFNINFPFSKLLLPLTGLALIGSFIFSGLYTINESDRGVITRFGQYTSTSDPGLNLKIPFIDKVYKVNVQQVNEINIEGTMLTKDENVVNVTMTIQYRINQPEHFLFNVDDPEKTLIEASESSLRYVIGHMDMDDVLTTGRSTVRENTRVVLIEVLERYKIGVNIVDVNFQSARPPEEVKASFDDAIKAQEDEQRYIREAEAYQRSKEPIARGQAKQLIAQAEGYAKSIVAQAEGQAAQFNRLLPEFLANPSIFKQRYYLETIASLYSNTPKIILQDGVNLNFLSLDKLLSGQQQTPTNNLPPGTLLLDPAQQSHNLSVKEFSNSTPSVYTPSSTPSITTPSQEPANPAINASPSDKQDPRQVPSRFNGNRLGGN